MKILVLNAGSSSQKSSLYELEGGTLPDTPLDPVWEGFIDWTHQQGVAELKVKTAKGASLKEELPTTSKPEVVAHLLRTLWEGDTQVVSAPSDIHVVGHRVVHGGAEYRESTLVTPDVKEAIARLSVFAPIHNPANLEGIEAIEHALGTEVQQVAVFDTAFHSSLPAAAYVYPGPHEWLEQGIRRYGFHGISHQYAARRAAQLLGRDLQDLHLITCHLGNGCSLAAVQGGCSVDTTMGFTPLEGLMMGTRSGSVDPGILIHLMRASDLSADDLDRMLNRASGLQGISGISNDMRQIFAEIESGSDRAQLALDIFVHRLRSHMGAMLASLGGLDALVFTAGIGEHSPPIRALACEAFEFLGVKLDPARNEASPVDEDITLPDAKVRVLTIKAREEWAIAEDCWRLTTQ